MMACFRIAWIAVRELIHEKVFYLLASFAVLSLGLSLILGQLTYAEQAKLTLDFMLGGIELSMLLFSVFMGISLFQREMTQGSISMVLSKPIARASFLVGKYLGQLLVQTAVIAVMGALTLLSVSRFPGMFSLAAVLQTLGLFAFEVAVLTAVTYFFAVNAGAITTAVVTVCVFLIGHFRDTVNKNLPDAGGFSAWSLVKTITPDFEVFNMKALASYGQTIGWTEFGWAAVYAGCCIFFFLLLAGISFQAKDIAT
jgi:Cu-processing system permease protein